MLRPGTEEHLSHGRAGPADDMPLVASPAEDPGSNDGGDQVVFDGVIGPDRSPPARGDREGERVTGDHFDLRLEYPGGEYLRWVDRED